MIYRILLMQSPVSYEIRCVTARPHYRDEFTTQFGDPHFTCVNHNEPVSAERDYIVTRPTHGEYGFSQQHLMCATFFSPNK